MPQSEAEARSPLSDGFMDWIIKMRSRCCWAEKQAKYIRGQRSGRPKPFELPPANRDMRRVYAYLVKHRHIAWAVVEHFAKTKTLYEDEKYHNCVFVGTDEDGIARHAHKRSTNSYQKAFRLNVEGGDPRYSFHHIGTDGSLYVFEAPIDLLSYITLHPKDWKSQSYVACCGVSFIPVQKMVERMPQVETVYLCLDNDKAGHAASMRMARLLSEMGIPSERMISDNKDWNEDIVAKYEKKEEIGLCQVCGY